MPAAVMVMVGAAGGAGAGVLVGGGVGAAGDPPLEHAATDAREMTTTTKRITPDACPAEAVNEKPRRTGGAPDRRKLPYHDCRRVVIGSTDAARRAGRKHASSATAHSSEGTAMKVTGSSVPTP
jgi:hypothetical protein